MTISSPEASFAVGLAEHHESEYSQAREKATEALERKLTEFGVDLYPRELEHIPEITAQAELIKQKLIDIEQWVPDTMKHTFNIIKLLDYVIDTYNATYIGVDQLGGTEHKMMRFVALVHDMGKADGDDETLNKLVLQLYAYAGTFDATNPQAVALDSALPTVIESGLSSKTLAPVHTIEHAPADAKALSDTLRDYLTPQTHPDFADMKTIFQAWTKAHSALGENQLSHYATDTAELTSAYPDDINALQKHSYTQTIAARFASFHHLVDGARLKDARDDESMMQILDEGFPTEPDTPEHPQGQWACILTILDKVETYMFRNDRGGKATDFETRYKGALDFTRGFFDRSELAKKSGFSETAYKVLDTIMQEPTLMSLIKKDYEQTLQQQTNVS